MPPNFCPPERAIGISRQERDGVRKISLPPQKDLEGRLLRRNDRPSFTVVADALATGEPRLSRRGRASKHLHAEAVAILLLFGNQPCSFANDARWSSNERGTR